MIRHLEINKAPAIVDVVVIVSNPVNVYTNQLMYTFPRECIHSLKSQGAF